MRSLTFTRIPVSGVNQTPGGNFLIYQTKSTLLLA